MRINMLESQHNSGQKNLDMRENTVYYSIYVKYELGTKVIYGVRRIVVRLWWKGMWGFLRYGCVQFFDLGAGYPGWFFAMKNNGIRHQNS